MLWIREEEVFPRSDYGAPPQSSREHDLDAICGDECREDLESPPPLFCRNPGMVFFSAMASLALDQLQEHMEA